MEFDQDSVSDHKLDFTTIQDMVNTHVFGEGAPSHTRAARPSRAPATVVIAAQRRSAPAAIA